MVHDWNPETGTWAAPVVCLFNDEPLLRRDWDAVAVRGGDWVDFVELPAGGGGGGSNPLALILTVVIGIVAWVVAPMIPGLLGITGGILGKLVTGLAAGLIMAVGGMLVGAIVKGPAVPSGLLAAQSAEAASPTYSVNAANNQARLYQPVGEGFGRIRVVPDRAAQAYAKYSANEMYLCQVFGLGRGEYQVESMAFGDTVFWRDGQLVAGYDVEVELLAPGEPVTLFPDNVEAGLEVSGQALLATNSPEYVGPLGPFSCNPPGTRVDHVVLNVVMPQGMGWYNDQGGLNAIGIGLRVELRRIGDDGETLGDWYTVAEPYWAMATLTPQRFSIDVRPTRGRWECRVGRTDAQGMDGRTLNSVTWESMFAIIPGTLTYKQSTVAIRTKATNLLSQSAASTFSVVQTRILPEWDPATGTWGEPKPTRKFAAAVSQVLKASWGGGLPDKRIDLDSLWGTIQPILDWNGWTFDGYFDGAYKVWSLVMEMCQAFRVVPRVTAGGVSFVYDRPGRPPRHMFTPANIRRGSLSVVYNTFTDETPDNVIWSYLDEAAGFQQREVNAKLPDCDTENPVIKSFIGVVKRKQAFEMGIYAVACNRHRRIQVKFQTEGAGRLISMGDVCVLSHPYFASLVSGVVRGWDAEALTVDLGAAPEGGTPPGQLYLALTRPNGLPWGPCKLAGIEGRMARFDEADLTALERQGQERPFGFMRDGSSSLATAWTIQEGRPFEGRLLVQSVTPADAWHYEITAINDSDQVDDYADLPVPPWNYRGDGMLDPTVPSEPPTGFTIDVTFRTEKKPISPLIPIITMDVDVPIVKLGWLPVPWAESYEVEYRNGHGEGEWVSLGKVYANQGITFEPEAGPVEVRVRGLGSGGLPGPWGGALFDTADNSGTRLPASVTVGPYEGGELTVSWEPEPQWALSQHAYWLTFAPQNFEVTVKGADFAVRRVATLGPEARSWTYTAAMAVADGGAERELYVSVRQLTYWAYHVEGHWTSGPMRHYVDAYTIGPNSTWSGSRTVFAEDAPPVLTGEPTIAVGPDSMTLAAAPASTPNTGYVIARGAAADFTLAGVVETRTADALPFVWTGLQPETEYHFRMAAKDALADLRGYHLDLAWSEAVTLTTLAAGA
jgi:hypothetical protein